MLVLALALPLAADRENAVVRENLDVLLRHSGTQGVDLSGAVLSDPGGPRREAVNSRIRHGEMSPYGPAGGLKGRGMVQKFNEINGVPDGIRTRVTAVKGRCPGPLDDGDADTILQTADPGRPPPWEGRASLHAPGTPDNRSGRCAGRDPGRLGAGARADRAVPPVGAFRGNLHAVPRSHRVRRLGVSRWIQGGAYA